MTQFTQFYTTAAHRHPNIFAASVTYYLLFQLWLKFLMLLTINIIVHLCEDINGCVFPQAVERGNKECPICLTFLEEESLVAQLPVASAATSVTTDDNPKSKQHQILQHELQQKAKPTSAKTSIQLKTRSFQHRSHAKMSTSSSEGAKNSPDHSNSAKPRNHSGLNNEGTKVSEKNCIYF